MCPRAYSNEVFKDYTAPLPPTLLEEAVTVVVSLQIEGKVIRDATFELEGGVVGLRVETGD